MLRACSFAFCFLLSISSFATESKTVAKKPPKEKMNSGERYENLELFQKVIYFVEQNYVEEVKNKDLIYGAIKGMIETLDPHSSFLAPEIFKNMRIDTSGKFGGVGIELGVKDSYLTVVSPIEDTPAFKAGIKPGDRILKINGESAKGLSLEEAVTKMRGKKGTDVILSIARKGVDTAKEFKLTRQEIKIKATKTEILEPGFFYARLTSFNERVGEDLKKAMNDFENKNGKIKGMVLDLRNNPGGLLDQAVDVTSLFIDEGVVVSTRGRHEKAEGSETKKDEDVKYAKKGMARKDFPLAVLVNGSSASASEIVAGALQDHKRAVVMGQSTFGKGSVQTVVELGGDVGLKLTIARYYTPNGRSIQAKGIQPDLLLEDYDQKTLEKAKRKQSSFREKDLRHHMESEDEMEEEIKKEVEADKADKDSAEDEKPFVAREDYQVIEALNYIKSYRLFDKGGVKQ